MKLKKQIQVAAISVFVVIEILLGYGLYIIEAEILRKPWFEKAVSLSVGALAALLIALLLMKSQELLRRAKSRKTIYGLVTPLDDELSDDESFGVSLNLYRTKDTGKLYVMDLHDSSEDADFEVKSSKLLADDFISRIEFDVPASSVVNNSVLGHDKGK